MTPALLLFRIEFRRNIGLWLFLPLVTMAMWVAWEELDSTVWLWMDTSYALLYSVVLLGPFAGAISAWVAARERRHRLEDLLTSMPFSPLRRKVATWIGTVGWGMLAYLGAGLIIGTGTAINATWGKPYLSVLLVGLTAIGAHSAIGFTIGTWLPSRLTAPLVGAVLFVAQSIPGYNPTAIKYLTPISEYAISMEVFYQPRTEIHVAQIAWFIGLAGVALGVSLVPNQRSLLQIAATGCSLLVATIGAVILIRADGTSLQGAEASYSPVCVERAIPVCLHPAYEPMLQETADLIERLTSPIAGLPGSPAEAEQRSYIDALSDSSSDKILVFELRSTARDPAEFALGGYNALADILVRKLMNDEPPGYPSESTPREQRAKQVVANWLLIQAGIPLTESFNEFGGVLNGYQLEPDQEAALERFMALDEDERRAWLEANFAALKAGHLTLEDLP